MKTKIRTTVGALALLGGGLLTGAAITGGAATAASLDDGAEVSTSAAQAEALPGHEHTEVTGEALAEVTAAVEAEDPSIEVTSVREDPDGSYDVLGTRDGAPVMLEVSADLATVEEREGGPGDCAGMPGGPGGPGGPGALRGPGAPDALDAPPMPEGSPSTETPDAADGSDAAAEPSI